MIILPASGQDCRESVTPDSRSTLSVDDQTPNSSIIRNSRLPIEVLYIIFALLQDSPKACAAAARVCRFWSDAALDELWKSLPSFYPIIDVLESSSDLVELFRYDTPTLPAGQTWDRFNCYAARVREITCEFGYTLFKQNTAPKIVERLTQIYPGGIILPNLQKLCWKTEGSRTIDCVLSFCPPTLERISIILDSGEAVPDDPIGQLVHSLATLPNVFKAFELETVFFEIDTATMAVALETFIRSQPGLLELKLLGYPLQENASVLAACRTTPQLHTFYGITTHATREEYREVLGTIAKHCPSLRNLKMGRMWRYGMEDPSTDATDLAPLFDCSVLEDITLWFEERLELDDQGIRRMGCAWNRLETLKLYAEASNTTPISCLVAFAESFPVLKHLESEFDRSGGLPPLNEVAARFWSLRQLVILGEWIYGDKIAEFLERVCSLEVRVYSSDGTLLKEESGIGVVLRPRRPLQPFVQLIYYEGNTPQWWI